MTRAKAKILFRGSGGLWTVADDNTGHTLLHKAGQWPPVGGSLHGYTWSRDGQRIAFCLHTGCSNSKDIRSRLFAVDAGGTNLRNLSQSAGAAMPRCALYPTWSPDSQSIAFVGSLGGESFSARALWSIGADGTDLRPLLEMGRLLREPMWSPDGSRILFLTNEVTRGNGPWRMFEKHEDFNLHVVDADGSNQRQLSQIHSSGPQATSWSPDGERIAWRDEGGLFLINADGTGRTQLTHVSGHTQRPLYERSAQPSIEIFDATPAWSPDGSRIAFVSNRTGCDQIYTIAPDGTGLTQLTHELGGDHGPRWSHDGSRIAFVSMREFEERPVYFRDNAVWVMDADGSGQLCVSREQRPCDSPDIF